jgi:sulfatase maturation enzyme AslB (radical SAM superfamily)
MIKEIFKALSMLIIVSMSISGVVSLFLNWDLIRFGIGSVIAIVLQIAIKWYVDQIKQTKVEELIKEIPPATIKMNIECAFCQKPSIIDYDVYREEYECEHCNNVNSIYGKFYTARKVLPLDSVLTSDNSSLI